MKTHDIDAVTRGLNPSPGTSVSESAWAELSDGITATVEDTTRVTKLAPRRTPARPRLALVAACTLLIGGVVAAAVVDRPGQDLPQALSVTDQGEWLTVRVVDQYADPEAYNQQFKKLGLDIKVRMVPVAPTAVGKYATFLYYDGSDGTKLGLLKPGENCPSTLNASDPGCQYGVEVGKKFKGKAEIMFGRAAKPGELYQYMPSESNAPGEELAGMAYKNKRVAEVQKLIAARGVTVGSYLNSKTELVDGVTTAKEVDPAPGDWYVHEARPQSPGVVQLWIGSEPAK
ncbi:hypothetical protein [Kribbella catacumbae]|uniref:hypothetical protein n=1 Tax=Kribbella catacumbae TaxID=460086 RepID=UPI00037B4D18|nr:hypothetical protein [Kribbella catacumbae]